MKKKLVLYLCLVFVLGSCDSEDAPGCIQTKGKEISTEIDLPSFEKIAIKSNVKLYLTYSEKQAVILETGENLVSDVKFSVQDDQLLITNESTCNFFRDYETVKVFVSSPELTEIRNGSPYEIESTNLLSYQNITLISENDKETSYHNDGDFKLQLKADKISIVNNGFSNYFLSGSTNTLKVGFYNGGGRLEAENLIAKNVSIYHRGTNKMIVNPQKSLKGTIYSTGDLISVNHPPIVEVEELYTGRLIFQ